MERKWHSREVQLAYRRELGKSFPVAGLRSMSLVPRRVFSSDCWQVAYKQLQKDHKVLV